MQFQVILAEKKVISKKIWNNFQMAGRQRREQSTAGISPRKEQPVRPERRQLFWTTSVEHLLQRAEHPEVQTRLFVCRSFPNPRISRRNRFSIFGRESSPRFRRLGPGELPFHGGGAPSRRAILAGPVRERSGRTNADPQGWRDFPHQAEQHRGTCSVRCVSVPVLFRTSSFLDDDWDASISI